MKPSSGQNTKRKNITRSIRAGIWHALGGFLIVTVLAMAVFWFLMSIIISVTGLFSEVGLPLAVALSPIAGLVGAIVMGIRRGRQTYERLSAGN